MRIIYIVLLLSVSASLFSQEYNILLIPDSLKKNADVVNRFEETILEIKSPGKATVRERQVYTIMNESADKYSYYAAFYDKFTSTNYISGTMYDAMGKVLKRIKKKDMRDLPYDTHGTLLRDTRVRINDFYNRIYPYTVAYEKEEDIDGLLFFPNWNPLSGPYMSAQYSKFIVIAPKDYVVRYKSQNCSVLPVISEIKEKKIYTWEIRNLPARILEANAPAWTEIVPNVSFAPSDFEIEGYKGNMSTWEDFGKFEYQLFKDRDVLPDDIRIKVHELTDNIKDNRQKTMILYEFLQKNTRYISVQLGLGGWQPFDAAYVSEKKYGDCKALSNYMVALLKEAGIKAYCVIIWGGTTAQPLKEDFPSFNQFNHVISCVPLFKDTLWLESTSQTVSAGFMGSFTGDRKAILIDEKGGHIVNTPVYSSSNNLQLRKVDAVIDEEGNLHAQLNTLFTGIQQERTQDLIHEVSKGDREKYLNNSINLPTFQVEKSNYEEEKGVLPAVKEYLELTSTGYASISGKRLFIAPDLFNKTQTRYSADSIREYDILYNYAFRDIDSILIKIPLGYTPESLPRDVKIESRFGKYIATTKIEGNKITYYRLFERNRGRFPAKDYDELVKFQERVFKADHTIVVMVKAG